MMLSSPAFGPGEGDESLSGSMSGEEQPFADRWRTSHTVALPATAKAKAAARASSSSSDTSCCLSFCLAEKPGNRKHKFCEHHRKMYAAMLHEASKAGKKLEVERVLSDPTEAEKLLCAKMDFEKSQSKGHGPRSSGMAAAATFRDVADGGTGEVA